MKLAMILSCKAILRAILFTYIFTSVRFISEGLILISIVFLTADNTVLSFFESSAEDIEAPIISRLSTPETILRRSLDASMIVQVIRRVVIRSKES